MRYRDPSASSRAAAVKELGSMVAKDRWRLVGQAGTWGRFTVGRCHLVQLVNCAALTEQLLVRRKL
jgi:hypothetical protein